jgi:hypothetical protein
VEKTTEIVSAPAPLPTEDQQVTVSERGYLVLLPPSVILFLYDLHPLTPIVGINVMLTFGIAASVIGIIEAYGRRKRTVNRDVSFWNRIRRVLWRD